MRWLIYLWTTPSAFVGDWRGYLLNQMGHAYGIGGATTFLFPWLFPWNVAAYAILVELMQRVFWGAETWDCLEDLGHVSLVACAAFYGIWPLLIVHACFVAAGVGWRRSTNRGS